MEKPLPECLILLGITKGVFDNKIIGMEQRIQTLKQKFSHQLL